MRFGTVLGESLIAGRVTSLLSSDRATTLEDRLVGLAIFPRVASNGCGKMRNTTSLHQELS